MNILIFDPSLTPDVAYQQRIVKLFSSVADVSIRFASGILQATWHTRHFRPDVIVFDWICDHLPLGELITLLQRIEPDAAMFHLDGGGLIVNAGPIGSLAKFAVPVWLHNIASHWILARCVPTPATDGSKRTERNR